MSIIINWIVSALVVLASAYILPGVKVDSFGSALVLVVVLGLINALLKPILVVLTLPVNIITLGLFTLVINGVLVLLAAKIVPGFQVRSFGWAVLFSIVLACVNWFVNTAFRN
jgi:putative membrane protein